MKNVDRADGRALAFHVHQMKRFAAYEIAYDARIGRNARARGFEMNFVILSQIEIRFIFERLERCAIYSLENL